MFLNGFEKVVFFVNEILKENGVEIVLWNNVQYVILLLGSLVVVKIEDGKFLCKNCYLGNSLWLGYI